MPILRPLSTQARSHDKKDRGAPAVSAGLLYEGWDGRDSFKRVTNQQGKVKTYWIDEIAFLKARLNGSQGDIDSEDRAACEEALKAAKANLATSR